MPKIKNGFIWVNGVERQFYPASKWVPNENTVLYLPLNTTDTYQDKSLTPHTTSNSGTQFGTYGGVDCASFNGNYIQLENVAIDNEFTFSRYQYTNAFREANTFSDYTVNSFLGTFKFGVQSGGVGGEFVVGSNTPSLISCSCDVAGTTVGSNVPVNSGQRYYFTATRERDPENLCKYICRRYVNGQELYRTEGGCNRDLDARQGRKYIGWDCYYTDQGTKRYLYGYLSNFIAENGARSPSFIATYFNSTKDPYGIV